MWNMQPFFVRVNRENKAKRHTIVRCLGYVVACFKLTKLLLLVSFSVSYFNVVKNISLIFVESPLFFHFKNILLASEG